MLILSRLIIFETTRVCKDDILLAKKVIANTPPVKKLGVLWWLSQWEFCAKRIGNKAYSKFTSD